MRGYSGVRVELVSIVLTIRIGGSRAGLTRWGRPSSTSTEDGRRSVPPEDSRFAESPIANFDDVVVRIKAAKNPAELRQVLSELETARKEDVIEIARRVTGQKEKSTKRAVDLIWREWYLERV